ncbi:hypothetical protein AAMO2058_001424600 [Amorphochlora amoebiformis]
MSKPKYKVVVRCLPKGLSKQDFLDSVKSFEEKYSWSYFRPGKKSVFPARSRPGVAYLYFQDTSDVYKFHEFIQKEGIVYKGKTFKPQVEFAPFQKVPKRKLPSDSRKGKYQKDSHYSSFIEKFEAKNVELPGEEKNLQEKSNAQEKEAEEEQPEIPPIIAFLTQKSSRKSRLTGSRKASNKERESDFDTRRDLDSQRNKKEPRGGRRRGENRENEKRGRDKGKDRQQENQKSEEQTRGSQRKKPDNKGGPRKSKLRPKVKPTQDGIAPKITKPVKIMKREAPLESKAGPEGKSDPQRGGNKGEGNNRRKPRRIVWRVRPRQENGEKRRQTRGGGRGRGRGGRRSSKGGGGGKD